MLAIVKNNVRLLLAKKGLMFVLIALPVLLVALGLALNSSSNFTMRIVVDDLDQTALSQDLIKELEASGNVMKYDNDPEQLVIDQKVDSLLRIPKGFEQHMLEGTQPKVELVSLKGQEVTSLTEAQINLYLGSMSALNRLEQASDSKALIKASNRINDSGIQFEMKESANQVNSGLELGGAFLLYILSLNMLLVSGLILSDKAWNTLERIRRAPVTRLEYLLANVVTGIFFLVVNLIGIYVLASNVFHIKTTPEMYLIWLVYGLVWILIGIFLALVVPSSRIYGNVTPILTTITAMLGGSFWPLYLVPELMQKIAAITPHYWANQWLDLVQQGSSFLSRPQPLIALLGFFCLFFALGLFSLARKRKSQVFI